MPLIEYPDVPPYPGVPSLLRQANVAVAPLPVLVMGLGVLQNVLSQIFSQTPRWGIFDAAGNELGAASAGLSVNSIVSSILSQQSSQLSVFSFNYAKESRISDFQVEAGSFASYNKVELPANPTITLNLDGTESDRTTFLNILENAATSTDLYNIVTPEVTYIDYSIERYTYDRAALRGATLLRVDVSLKEIRQVSAAFSQVTTPISNPQNASATPTVNNGKVQPGGDTSTLKSIANGLGITQ